jgi:hypothetical protein
VSKVVFADPGDPTEQYGIDTIDQLPAIVWSRMR